MTPEERIKISKKEYSKVEKWYETTSIKLDETIIKIATASAIAPITLLGILENPHHTIELSFAWFFLITTIIINLITRVLALESALAAGKEINRWTSEVDTDELSIDNLYSKIANKLNTISVFTLIFGISLLGYFTFLNIQY